jgi:coproporphyrinogen III oxidase-like Fe-S oxidoreductase
MPTPYLSSAATRRPAGLDLDLIRKIGDVLGLNPDRLSVFSYAHVPWIKPAQKIFDDRKQLPDAEAKLAMFAVAHDKLTAEDRRRRTIIMRLMCDRRLNYAAVSRAIGVDFESEYGEELRGLADLQADGLIAPVRGGWEVTPLGVPLLRVIASRFDAHFSADPSGAAQGSPPRRHAQAI